jgi:predicted anti-sigma-YlaC factor YlaD
MRTLPALESERLEEHLLICSACRDRLEAMDEYVAAMRLAAVTIRRVGHGR